MKRQRLNCKPFDREGKPDGGACYKSAICPGLRFLVDFLARFIVRVPLAAFWGLLRASLGRLRGLLAAGAGVVGVGALVPELRRLRGLLGGLVCTSSYSAPLLLL